jgi:hypothetical protein
MNRRRLRPHGLAATIALLLAACGTARAQLRPFGDATAIVGARIEVGDGRMIPKGTVLVRGGLIEAVGPGLVVPPDAEVIEAAGRFVTPGLIDAHSLNAEDESNGGSDSVTAEVRIHDAIDPRSLSLYQKLAAGFTTSLLHGSANAIGGQSVAIKHRRQRPVEELIVPDAPRMIEFAFHVDSARGIRDADQFAERWGVRPIIAGGHEAGKVADLLAKKRVPVIYQLPDIDLGSEEQPLNDYDPVEVTTSLHFLFIAGRPIPLESRHTRLYAQYRRQ